MEDPVEHIEKVQDAVRHAAEKVGRAEATHGPNSKEAVQARKRWNQLMNDLSTEIQELALIAEDLKREYF